MISKKVERRHVIYCFIDVKECIPHTLIGTEVLAYVFFIQTNQPTTNDSYDRVPITSLIVVTKHRKY